MGGKIRSVRRMVYLMSHIDDMLKISWKDLGNFNQKIEILTCLTENVWRLLQTVGMHAFHCTENAVIAM